VQSASRTLILPYIYIYIYINIYLCIHICTQSSTPPRSVFYRMREKQYFQDALCPLLSNDLLLRCVRTSSAFVDVSLCRDLGVMKDSITCHRFPLDPHLQIRGSEILLRKEKISFFKFFKPTTENTQRVHFQTFTVCSWSNEFYW